MRRERKNECAALYSHWYRVPIRNFEPRLIVKNYKMLEKKVYPVPPVIDKEISRLKLAGMGVNIDKLTKEQEKYLASWEMGT